MFPTLDTLETLVFAGIWTCKFNLLKVYISKLTSQQKIRCQIRLKNVSRNVDNDVCQKRARNASKKRFRNVWHVPSTFLRNFENSIIFKFPGNVFNKCTYQVCFYETFYINVSLTCVRNVHNNWKKSVKNKKKSSLTRFLKVSAYNVIMMYV